MLGVWRKDPCGDCRVSALPLLSASPPVGFLALVVDDMSAYGIVRFLWSIAAIGITTVCVLVSVNHSAMGHRSITITSVEVDIMKPKTDPKAKKIIPKIARENRGPTVVGKNRSTDRPCRASRHLNS